MAGGFRPIQDISGNSYTGKIQTFAVASGHSTLIAVGDLARITGTANANGLAEVDTAATAQTLTGPIVAIDYDISDLERKGLAAGTAGTVKVAVDRDLLMEAESSTTVSLDDVGSNADIVAAVATASGNLVNSNMTVNTTSPGSATAQIRIEGIKDAADGLSTGTTMFVRINESTLGVVGV